MLTGEEKRRLGALTLLDLVISIADIVFLALLLLIVQMYAGSDLNSNRFSFLKNELTDKSPVPVIVVFFLLFSIKNLLGFLVFRAQCRMQFRVAARISGEKLISCQQGDYSDHIGVDSAVHIRRVSYEPLEFCQHVLGGFLQIITQTVLIVLAITGIVLFNARLFLLVLVVLLPPVFIIFYLIKRRMSKTRGSARISSERSLQHLQEALSGFVESNIYDRNEVFLQRYLTHQQRYSRYLTNQTIVQGIPGRIIEIFALLGVVILIATSGGTGSHTAVITVGVFMAAAYKIIPGVVKILSLSGQINTYAFTLENLAAAASIAPASQQQPSDTPLKGSIRTIQFKDVQFHYKKHAVLRRLNFQMTSGDLVGITGPSGKGKTTLLNLLLGFLSPDAGEIRINDEVADAEARKRYWPDISYVRQQPFLIHDTILHNLTLHEYPPDGQRLRSAIRMSGLQSLVDADPEGLDKVITEGGGNISGGQRQRITIARALYKSAGVIILDEPFNQLDEGSEHSLLTHFVQLAREGKLIILITHNKKSLSFCNKVVSLESEWETNNIG
ncbi:MAG TPA: ABC transporter ATP-binding protein [Puia sp.]|nr:ABC transporter ATP-binding protein [Puia sp.]